MYTPFFCETIIDNGQKHHNFINFSFFFNFGLILPKLIENLKNLQIREKFLLLNQDLNSGSHYQSDAFQAELLKRPRVSVPGLQLILSFVPIYNLYVL